MCFYKKNICIRIECLVLILRVLSHVVLFIEKYPSRKQKLIMCILTDVASRKKNRNKYLVIYQTSHFFK